jgi:hypothetical protein
MAQLKQHVYDYAPANVIAHDLHLLDLHIQYMLKLLTPTSPPASWWSRWEEPAPDATAPAPAISEEELLALPPTMSDEEVDEPFPKGCPEYPRRTQMLGKLCDKGHEHGTTGQSLRRKRTNGKHGQCLKCHAEVEAQRKQRAAAREEKEATA